MLSFSPLTPQAAPMAAPYLLASRDRICDFTIGALLMWRDFNSTEYAIWQNSLFLKVRYQGQTLFTLPLGGDKPAAFQALIKYAASEKLPLILSPVTESGLRFLETLHTPMRAEPRRDWFDYLYDAAGLTVFKGKKYHGQRNHVNRFQKSWPGWSFAPAEAGDIPGIAAFLKVFFEQRPASDSIGAEEQRKTAELFRDPCFFGMLTGVLRVGPEIAAVAAGEISGDTLFVHIEKADTRFSGVYPMMAQAFAGAYATGAVTYVNREEDDGIPGLRAAKLAYHPVRLIEKYLVYWGEG